MKLKTILLDDEIMSIQALEIDLRPHLDKLEILQSFSDPFEALTYVRNHEIELLFLDLQMPEMNGFDFLENLGDFDFQVIFVTAHEEYALRAFDFNAVDYILKPPMKKKLALAVEKAYEKGTPMNQKDAEALQTNFKLKTGSNLEKIAIPTSYGWNFVNANDIYYCQADGNYTKIFLMTGEQHLVSKTLKNFEELLDFEMFFRAHQSYLVNLNHVDNYVKSDGGYLKLQKGESIPVARSRKEELYRRMSL